MTAILSHAHPVLIIPPDEVYRRLVCLPSNGNIVKNSKQHSTAKHQDTPVHGLGRDIGAQREKDEDPDYKKESNGAHVDEDTKPAE